MLKEKYRIVESNRKFYPQYYKFLTWFPILTHGGRQVYGSTLECAKMAIKNRISALKMYIKPSSQGIIHEYDLEKNIWHKK